VGGATRNRVKDVVFREIDRIRIKGKEEAVSIYEPRDSAGDEVELHRMSPAPGLYAVCLARLEDLRLRPPPPWNGVTALDE
jgi:hypothetical protein